MKQNKISKVIFIQDEVENLSLTQKIEAPKVLDKIELLKKKDHKPETDLKPLFWENFPIEDFPYYLDFAKAANEKIGKGMVITVSKKAFTDKILNPNLGSIWYSCGSKEFKDNFSTPIRFAIATLGMQMISKEELKNLETEFAIVWQNYAGECETFTCKKSETFKDVKSKLVYQVDSDPGVNFEMKWDIIQEDGSGIYEDENFYFLKFK